MDDIHRALRGLGIALILTQASLFVGFFGLQLSFGEKCHCPGRHAETAEVAPGLTDKVYSGLPLASTWQPLPEPPGDELLAAKEKLDQALAEARSPGTRFSDMTDEQFSAFMADRSKAPGDE